MNEITKVFEFWKGNNHLIGLELKNIEKPLAIEPNRLIRITGLPVEQMPLLFGSKCEPIFYQKGERTHWGAECRKGNTVIKKILFEFSKDLKMYKSEKNNVEFKKGDLVTVNKKDIQEEHLLDLPGRCTLEVIRDSVRKSTLVLACRNYDYIRYFEHPFGREDYFPQYFVPYQKCQIASSEEAREFEAKDKTYENGRWLELNSHDDSYNTDRENFEALTDGQYGEYEDYRGDIDSLKNFLGL